MAGQNLAVKLCGILQSQTNEEVSAREWRLLGQEQDGSQLLSWVSIDKDDKEVLHVGIYTNKSKTLKILHTFNEKLNIIQASVNPSLSLLVYVVKILPNEENELKEPMYQPYLVCLLPHSKEGCTEVEEKSSKQIMLQFVYGKSNKYSPGIRNDRFLFIKHLEYIKIYRSPSFLNEFEDGTERWGFDGIYPEPETIVESFTWAQWDCAIQALYYIHYRRVGPAAQGLAEGGERDGAAGEAAPALSALQFHADLPHETVLNIPLSLPQVSGGATEGAACGEYEDDPVPLRVHDCSIDLLILCDPRGRVCICHHYLYKALDDSTNSLVLEDSTELKESGVNFAYSITVLHHGCVVHSAVPDLPWALAKSLRPSYTLYAGHNLLVHIPNLYTHLIDISPHHEPCCHIVMPSNETTEVIPKMTQLLGWGPHTMVDLNTLDISTVVVTEKDLVATFKGDTQLENQLSIMHYLLQHEGNTELTEQLMSWLAARRLGSGELARGMQEFLVAHAFAGTRRALPAAAQPHVQVLPYCVHLKFADVKVVGGRVCVWCAGVWRVGAGGAGVLAPRQRVAQFAEDAWTRVWRALAARRPARLPPAAAARRLQHTVNAYRPEALSRCSTPLSPVGAPPTAARRTSMAAAADLPFMEVDLCTASRQEHVVAANLREVSVHLMRELGESQAGPGAEGGVHALATRYAAAQLDASRALCRAACRASGAAAAATQQKGFPLVDDMDPKHRFILFKMLECYYMACETLAFPMPQGFSSFFTYLGFKAVPFSTFIQYVHRNVLELQIDVLKAIIQTADGGGAGVNNKLRLLQLAGEGRGRRALAAWRHRAALQLRARDHAAALLSGGGRADPARARHPGILGEEAGRVERGTSIRARDWLAPASRLLVVATCLSPNRTGIGALPSGERLSPLDTFLDLLTAKASLNELDFNLIIEATLASVQRHTDD